MVVEEERKAALVIHSTSKSDDDYDLTHASRSGPMSCYTKCCKQPTTIELAAYRNTHAWDLLLS